MPISELIALSILRIVGLGRCPNPSTFYTPHRCAQAKKTRQIGKFAAKTKD